MKTNTNHFRTIGIRLFILLVLLFSVSQVKTQTWPMPGATWEYCITGWNGLPAGHLVMGVTGDTLINNLNYSIISNIESSGSMLFNANSSLMTLYTRFSNDSVFRFVENEEYLYFNFNSNSGDVYTTFRSAGHNLNWNDSACTSVLPIMTMQVDALVVNGIELRRSVLRDTLFKVIYNRPDHDEIEYTLLDRIGIINGLPLINTKEMTSLTGYCELPSDYATYTLGSYYDDTFATVEFLYCEGVGVKEIQQKESDILVYPNPANEYIVFESQHIKSGLISISDIYGRAVAKVQVTGEKTILDTKGMQAGVYLYQLENSTMQGGGKFVIGK